MFCPSLDLMQSPNDTVHAETQVSEFESLMTVYVMFKMITSFYLRGKTRKQEK